MVSYCKIDQTQQARHQQIKHQQIKHQHPHKDPEPQSQTPS